MNIYFTITLIVLSIGHNAIAQGSTLKDGHNKENMRAFIPGYKDTILAPNMKPVMAIDPSLLLNGFELQLTDSSFEILHFRLTFDTECCITELVSNGNKIIPRNDSIISYNAITEARLITVEEIVVRKNNISRKISPLIYYTFK